MCSCKATTFILATLPRLLRTSTLGVGACPQDTGHLISHVDTERRTHECSDKSCILAGLYQVLDVVFHKHGRSSSPHLWCSTMLLRDETRGSTVRGNVAIISTVPQPWDAAKRFRPASRWHFKITNTIDPWICHRNLRSSVRSSTEYHSNPQP